MTKQEAIANHRKMWRWIADETTHRKRAIGKIEYFIFIGTGQKNAPFAHCYCCQYVIEKGDLGSRCTLCPVLWGTENNRNDNFCMGDGAYNKWADAVRNGDWAEAAALARQIAELPEREERQTEG